MRYIPALDGIRTLAVIAVVLYHLHLPWAQGGLLGVTVFFVLSGYLITRLLIGEFSQSGTINLASFWVRRVRRLVPATVTVVVVTAVLCTIFNHVMLTKMRPDILPSLLFFNNWWQIINNVSYFNALGDPSPLTHFWSLAIEEQFYLVWPPLLFVMLRLGASRRVVRRIVLVLALVSAGAMMLLYSPGADPSRLYYGTDTRAFSLLLGAWMAFIPEASLRPRRLAAALGIARFLPASLANDARNAQMTDAELASVNAAAPSSYNQLERSSATRMKAASARPHARGAEAEDSPATNHAMDILGVIGLVGLALMVVFTNGYTAFQYQGGTLLCSVLTLMVIASAVQPAGVLARVLALPPLVWVGQRSYSIYLWHYPLLLLMNPVANVNEVPWWMTVTQLAIVLAAAEISYRFIETPFRHGAFGALLRRIGQVGMSPRALLSLNPIGGTLAGVLLLVALGGLVFVPDTSALSDEGAALLEGESSGQVTAGGDAAGNGADAATNTAGTAGTGGEATGDASAADTGDQFPEGSYDVLMIGDSVSLRAVGDFQATFPHGFIDAAKSRQFAQGEAAYESYVQQNLAGKIAVFALGTNGLVTDDMIDSLMADVGERRIAVFVNTRSPQPWVADTNAAIGRAPERYSNVRVIDWYSYSANRNDLFDGDGTHLSATGAQEYIQLINDAISADLPVHPEDHVNDPVPTAVRNTLDAFKNAAGTLETHTLGADR